PRQKRRGLSRHLNDPSPDLMLPALLAAAVSALRSDRVLVDLVLAAGLCAAASPAPAIWPAFASDWACALRSALVIAGPVGAAMAGPFCPAGVSWPALLAAAVSALRWSRVTGAVPAGAAPCVDVWAAAHCEVVAIRAIATAEKRLFEAMDSPVGLRLCAA